MKKQEILFPSSGEQLDQNQEFFILKNGNEEIKIKFHEYEKIYPIPGLYETIFHQELKCQSPEVISQMLLSSIEAEGEDRHLRILDFGAGNGIVAEKFQEKNPDLVVGIDILEEAKEAANRDRAEVYDDYIVADLGHAGPALMDKLESLDFNTMVSVAALGFDHIPPEGFIQAFNLVENDGWVAFNLRDKFLTKNDSSGFRKTLEWMADEFMELKDEKTYRHRYSLNGEPINYTALVARKLKDIEMIGRDLDREAGLAEA